MPSRPGESAFADRSPAGIRCSGLRGRSDKPAADRVAAEALVRVVPMSLICARRTDWTDPTDLRQWRSLEFRSCPPSIRLAVPKFLLLLTVVMTSLAAAPSAGQQQSPPLRYNRDVLPILAEKCFKCHGFDPAAREADLRLDVRSGATALREGTRAVSPGMPDSSELVRRIESPDPEMRMPPVTSGKQLTREERNTLRRWVEQGAPYEAHWSFVMPTKVEPPPVDGARRPIDRFIRARMNSEDLEPAPVAPAATLIRRVSLDLIGLPPTPEEVEAFERAAASDPHEAWRALTERLLKSPHYGERWGRWWLDQARYADSNGYSIDAPRSIWKYRDWVVSAMNDDMPFDQFTIEQLAGDLLPGAAVSQQVATGFHRNTQINQEGGIDKEQYRIDSIFDRVATTGSVWLGLTIGCAQCHDHKFDPIAQREFYQLFAFFNNQDEPSIKVFPPGVSEEGLNKQRQAAKQSLVALLGRQIDDQAAWEQSLTEDEQEQLPAAAKKALETKRDDRKLSDRLALFAASPAGANEEFRELRKQYERLNAQLQSAPTTMVLRELPEPRKTAVMIKGDFTRLAEEVAPGTPGILHPLQKGADAPTRLDLARWMVSEENPLTARVIMNRVWQQYFGRGLVATENDFGMLGARPSHPQLLDWLACEFIDSGWSLKHMHRLIVDSDAYQQASSVGEFTRSRDPDNRWLSRQTRLRLEAEIVRDVALTASGLLAPKLGGPPVFPPIPPGVMSQGQVAREWQESTGEDRYRRGLYTFFYRATPPPSLKVFDAPDGYSVCTRRTRSNTPLQALTLMNDAAFFEFAQALAEIIKEQGLEVAFRRCTSRWPVAEELAVLEKLDSLTAARTLLNLDETITRE